MGRASESIINKQVLTQFWGAYRYTKTGFDPKELPDLTGKTVIVTGGNAGIGYETCKALVAKNARVFMASRTKSKADDSIKKIIAEYPNGKLEFLQLDLSNMKKVVEAAKSFLALDTSLDILINNAGIMACPFELTEDNLEIQFATNHMGHFIFTMMLMPLLLKSSAPRIVNLSSHGHFMTHSSGLVLEKLTDETYMDPVERYGNSKLANILFTKELDRRYGHQGLYVNCAHPGVVATDLYKTVEEKFGLNSTFSCLRPLAMKIHHSIHLTPEQGAHATLYLAASKEVEEKRLSGKYFIPFGAEGNESKFAKDAALALKLWEYSEKVMRLYV